MTSLCIPSAFLLTSTLRILTLYFSWLRQDNWKICQGYNVIHAYKILTLYQNIIPYHVYRRWRRYYMIQLVICLYKAALYRSIFILNRSPLLFKCIYFIFWIVNSNLTNNWIEPNSFERSTLKLYVKMFQSECAMAMNGEGFTVNRLRLKIRLKIDIDLYIGKFSTRLQERQW